MLQFKCDLLVVSRVQSDQLLLIPLLSQIFLALSQLVFSLIHLKHPFFVQEVVGRGLIIVFVVGQGLKRRVNSKRLEIPILSAINLMRASWSCCLLIFGGVNRNFIRFNHVQDDAGIDSDLFGVLLGIINLGWLLVILEIEKGALRLHLLRLLDVFDVPGMGSYLIESKSFLRICVEYLLN